MEKDYSLLLPFDLEAAKAGALVTDQSCEMLWSYVAGPDARGAYALRIETKYIASYGEFAYPTTPGPLRMAPLCWVEGRPVYKVDVLYHPRYGKCVIDVLPTITDGVAASHDNGAFSVLHSPDADDLTWTQPKVKRAGWIAVKTGEKPQSYASWCSHVCETKEQAEAYYGDQPVCCIRIEWEE